MFELLLEIPVTFGPHQADWWMVGVTAASVAVSVWLAFLALGNARTAKEIANESAAREQLLRTAELKERGDAHRARVALAMHRTFTAFEQQREALKGETVLTTAPAKLRLIELEAEALAQIDLYPLSEDDEELRVWFASLVEELKDAPDPEIKGTPGQRDSFQTLISIGRAGATKWNNRAITARHLVVGEWPESA